MSAANPAPTPSTAPSLTRLQLDIRDSRAFRGSERLLIDALALRGGPSGDFICYPSYERLSRDTQLCVRQLRDTARKLSKAGFIKVKVRPNRPNLFRVNWETICRLAAEVRSEEKREAEALNTFDDALQTPSAFRPDPEPESPEPEPNADTFDPEDAIKTFQFEVAEEDNLRSYAYARRRRPEPQPDPQEHFFGETLIY